MWVHGPFLISMIHFISQCIRSGIAEWVCCPGEQSMVLVEELERCPAAHCWYHGDERAAAGFALARAEVTGRPVAVVTGSGGAATALTPVLVAAYYARRSLIVITIDSDRPDGGLGLPGRIEHSGLFGMYAGTVNVELPMAYAESEKWGERVQEGFPVHVNVCVGEGVRRGGEYDGLRVGPRPGAARFRGSLVALSQMLRFREYEGLVLVLGALNEDEHHAVAWLADLLRVPILAEPASNMREQMQPYALADADALLLKNPPPIVLRFGEVPTGPFWQALEEMPQVEVFSVTRTGFAGLRRPSHVFEGEIEQIMQALGDIPRRHDSTGLLAQSRRRAAQIEELLLAYPESEAALVRAFSHHAVMCDEVCLSGTRVSALWGQYAQTERAYGMVRCMNRHSGDSTVSAFLGYSADRQRACCLADDAVLIRDGAASSFLPQLEPGVRVVAVLAGDAAEVPESCVPAAGRMKDLAQLWKATYIPIYCAADFEALEALRPNDWALVHILPDPQQTSQFRRASY